MSSDDSTGRIEPPPRESNGRGGGDDDEQRLRDEPRERDALHGGGWPP